VPVPGLLAGTGRDQASTSVQSAASELLAALNGSGMLASVSWSQICCSCGDGAPSGLSLSSARLMSRAVCSTCR
jgi:hypothetical protein